MKNTDNNSKNKRKTNRWLMLLYDTLIYILCWLVIMLICPKDWGAIAIYALIGYVLFIGFRFLFSVYKLILRYGSVTVFARVICADAISAVLLIAINLMMENIMHIMYIPGTAVIGGIASFALISVAARVSYCYIYRFAKGNSSAAKSVRYLLEVLTLVDVDSNEGATLHVVLESRDGIPVYINELQRVVDKFAIRGKVVGIKQINKGYINRTYRVETLSENGHIHKYALQRINTNVFRDADLLMNNYKLVTDTLYGTLRLDPVLDKPAVQTLRPTKNGCSFLKDDSGCWRMMTYFDNVYSMDIPDNAEIFERAGYAFGKFIRALEHLEITAIKEVIPNFHNTKSRYDDLEKSIQRNAGSERVEAVQEEIAFIRARSEKFSMISDALENGEIPLRICHNDCNLNNILFDNNTHQPVAIIDLDTVMPSSPLYDYGDSMRIGTNTAKDDEKDLSKVSCDLNMYEHYARGYLKACGDMLTERELELMPYASLIITSEDGIRFLMDHIEGDTYYTICYPGQNLDRARTQLKLVEDMENKLPQIKQILRNIYKELGLKATI